MPFSHEFIYCVGMDVDPTLPPSELAELSDFYTSVHVPEVVAANPGFVDGTRFELLDQDPRGGTHAGPRWLAVYDLADEAAAQGYIERNDESLQQRPSYSPWPTTRQAFRVRWRLMWRRALTRGSADPGLFSIFMTGTDVPGDSTSDEVTGFLKYYDEHVSEMVNQGGYSRGTRYELERAFAHPDPGAPRFCGVYEADEAATTERQERHHSDAASGPPIWDRRESAWRTVYRRI